MKNADFAIDYKTIISKQNEEIAGLKAAFEEACALLEYYKEQLRLARHCKFGASSEKMQNPDQLCLLDKPIQLTASIRLSLSMLGYQY